MGTDQRMDALALANTVRTGKAQLKASWADRDQAELLREIAGMLDDPSETRLEAFSLTELLLAVPGIGKTKAKLLAIAAERLELTARVGVLVPRRRSVLAEVLRIRADDVEARHAA